MMYFNYCFVLQINSTNNFTTYMPRMQPQMWLIELLVLHTVMWYLPKLPLKIQSFLHIESQ